MIAVFFGLIGFIISLSDPLGGSLINCFKWMNIWFWIITIIGILIYAFFVIVSISSMRASIYSVYSENIKDFLAGFFGLSISSLFASIFFIRMSVLILLSNYLIDNINSSIDSFSMLTSKQILALIAIFIILLFFKLSISKTKTKTGKTS